MMMMGTGMLEGWKKKKGVIVLDGGNGEELGKRVKLDGKLWGSEVFADVLEEEEVSPESNPMYAVHAAYVDAGSDVITTHTYQATREGYAGALGWEDGHDAKFQACLARAAEVALAAAARKEGTLVALSCGSYGASLGDGSEFTGVYGGGVGKEQLVAFHAHRMRAMRPLVERGLDLLAFETIPSLEEVTAILEVLEGEGGTLGAWISLSGHGEDGERMADGTHLSQVGEVVQAFVDRVGDGIVVGLGLNCVDPERAWAGLGVLAGAVGIGLVVYPNAGGVFDAVSKTWDDQLGAEGVAEQVGDWTRALDGRLVAVGGCCQLGPTYISCLVSAVRG